MKTCRRCRELKPLEEFSRDARRPDGLRYECRPCNAAYQRERYQARREEKRAYHRARYARNPEVAKAASKAYAERNRDRRRSWHLRRLYGLDVADFDAMSEAQGNVCKLCDVAAPLVVDHDHATGVVRGLLCHRCNLLLGQIEKRGLQRMADYLDQAAKITNSKKGKK